MKKHLNLLVACWLVGAFMPITRAFIEPTTMNGITDVLQHSTGESAPRIILFLWLFAWFIGGAIGGLIRSVVQLGRAWCYEEVRE